MEAIDEYASPVASKECIVNSKRKNAIDCARAFSSATLCELAALNERELEARTPPRSRRRWLLVSC